MRRLSAIGLGICFFLTLQGRTIADDTKTPDLKLFHEEVKKLLEKHYPKAVVTLKDQTIYFEFNTRKFMIHEPLLTGEWQDANEELGPQKGGIMGNIELRAGEYGGMAAVPQSFDKRYFTVFLMAPYSKKLDHHLYIHLKYPREVPKEFFKEFGLLVEGFETIVTTRGVLPKEPKVIKAEDQRPKISAVEATGIAEKYLKREEIDATAKFIARVRYVDGKVAKITREPYWEISFEPINRQTLGGEIWVSVGMDGKCSHEYGK